MREGVLNEKPLTGVIIYLQRLQLLLTTPSFATSYEKYKKRIEEGVERNRIHKKNTLVTEITEPKE